MAETMEMKDFNDLENRPEDQPDQESEEET